MLKKTSFLLLFSVFTISLFLVSCGSNNGSSSGNAPEVVVGTDSNPIDGNPDVETVVINPGGGDLDINWESVSLSDYPSATITALGGSVNVGNDGTITITPADGSVEGTYTVTINTGEREYVLIIEVTADADGDGKPDVDVTTAISYPAGSHMILDLEEGKVIVGGQNYLKLTISSYSNTAGGYVLDSSISSIVIKDMNGNIISTSNSSNIVDPVTGDIISGNGADSYIITIIKKDGTIITINTDQNGKITSIPEEGKSHVLIDVVNGTATIVPAKKIGGVTIEALINISVKNSSGWVKLDSITDIKAYTADVNKTDLKAYVDSSTGSIAVPGLLFTASEVVIKETITAGLATHTIKIDANGVIREYTKIEAKTDGSSVITVIIFDKDGKISSYIQTSVVKGNGTTTTTITTVGVNQDGTATVTVVTTVIASDGSTTTTTVNTTTDSTGNIISTETNITYNRVMLILANGSVTSGNTVLTLTGNSGTGYTFLTNPEVKIISASAAGGSIQISDLSKITVDTLTGSLMINGNGTVTLVGPYEIKVSIGNSVYVIKTDASGKVVSILPGNVILKLEDGVMTYSDNEVLTIAYNNNNSTNGWVISSAISGLSAVDASGSGLNISIDPYSGNFVTDVNVTGTVTITFLYTDSQGNGITYTITVINGSVNSYTAEITNPSTDFDFSTVTNIKVFLNVVNAETGQPVKQASISLANSTSVQSWKGFTDDLGVSIFTATVAAASQTTSIAVTHAGYLDVESPITGIGKLIEIGKKIAMTPETVVIPPADTDGDGVADSEDNYPNDPTGAKMITGSYTFGFEDQYDPTRVNFNTLVYDRNLGVYMPSGNDADFNDLAVRLSIEEKIDSQNRITKIILKAKTIAALSGGNNSFGIYVNGQKYIMILKSQVSGSNPNCVLAPEVTLEIPFDDGISRNIIGAMPYDPFMISNGGRMSELQLKDNKSEVHLASVNTTYTGVTKGNGYLKTGNKTYVQVNGFVWALIIPENWQWPKEGTCIAIAYPTFVNWCNTDGEQDIQWYNSPKTPLSDYVVPRQ